MISLLNCYRHQLFSTRRKVNVEFVSRAPALRWQVSTSSAVLCQWAKLGHWKMAVITEFNSQQRVGLFLCRCKNSLFLTDGEVEGGESSGRIRLAVQISTEWGGERVQSNESGLCILCTYSYINNIPGTCATLSMLKLRGKTKNGPISHDHCSGQPGPCCITKHLFLFMYSNVWNMVRLPSQVIVNKPEDILRSSANAPLPAYQLECSAIPPCLNNSGNFIIVTIDPEYHNRVFYGSCFKSNQPTYNSQTWYLFIHQLLCS